MLGFDQISHIVLELGIPSLDIFLRQRVFIRVELVEVLFQLFLVFFLGLSADVCSLVLVHSEIVALSVVAIHTLQQCSLIVFLLIRNIELGVDSFVNLILLWDLCCEVYWIFAMLVAFLPAKRLDVVRLRT